MVGFTQILLRVCATIRSKEKHIKLSVINKIRPKKIQLHYESFENQNVGLGKDSAVRISRSRIGLVFRLTLYEIS